jgi:hypothetical protein
MRETCKAKNKALCPYHGVPTPSLTVKQVNQEMKDCRKELKEAKPGSAQAAHARMRELENRLEYLRGDATDPFVHAHAEESIESEIASYETQAMKEILGGDSPEFKAYSTDFPGTKMPNAEKKSVFSFLVTEVDSSAAEHQRSVVQNQFARKAALAYAKVSGYDNVTAVKTGIFQYTYVPYKENKAMSVAQWEELRRSDKVRDARREISAAVKLVKNDQARRLSK